MSSTEAYLGLDIGGTGAKAGVFDAKGKLLGFGHQTYVPDISPAGLVEIPVEKIYRAARAAARQALHKISVRVAALSVSSQGETFVALDDCNRPLYPAIVWYDSRAKQEADELRKISRRTKAIHEIFTAPKILWLQRHYPRLMRKARRYLLLPDYFAYRLTGAAVIDSNTAGSTGWYDEENARIDPEVLEALSVRPEQISEVVAPGTPIAKLKPAAAPEWGLSRETLLVAGTNDQYAGALGAGNCRAGIISETSGTCLALVTLTKNKPCKLPPGLFHGKFPIPAYWFILAFSKTAGVALDWFRREFLPASSWKELERLADAVPAGSNGLLALPYFDGAISPVPNPKARGAFYGLTLRHTKAEMFRALLESLAFALRENIEFINRNGFRTKVVRSIGGGAKNSLWLQIKADATGLPVEKPAVFEAATLGAAMLAAKGRGAFKSLTEASEALYRVEKVFMPKPAQQRQYQKFYLDYKQLKSKLYGIG